MNSDSLLLYRLRSAYTMLPLPLFASFRSCLSSTNPYDTTVTLGEAQKGSPLRACTWWAQVQAGG